MPAIIILALSGCTIKLWQPDYDAEYVSGFYANVERNELFVSTNDTGYIFPVDDETIEIMLLSRRVDFTPNFEKFYIDRQNNVSGTLTLVTDGDVDYSLKSQLTTLGFAELPTAGNMGHVMKLQKKLSGKRYTIEGELPLVKLEKEYLVVVAYQDSYTEVAGNIVATPAAIIIDAVVVVPTTFLIFGLISVSAP